MPAKPVPATKSSPARPMSTQDDAPVFGERLSTADAEAVAFGLAVGLGLAVDLGVELVIGVAFGEDTGVGET